MSPATNLDSLDEVAALAGDLDHRGRTKGRAEAAPTVDAQSAFDNALERVRQRYSIREVFACARALRKEGPRRKSKQDLMALLRSTLGIPRLAIPAVLLHVVAGFVTSWDTTRRSKTRAGVEQRSMLAFDARWALHLERRVTPLVLGILKDCNYATGAAALSERHRYTSCLNDTWVVGFGIPEAAGQRAPLYNNGWSRQVRTIGYRWERAVTVRSNWVKRVLDAGFAKTGDGFLVLDIEDEDEIGDIYGLVAVPVRRGGVALKLERRRLARSVLSRLEASSTFGEPAISRP